MDQAADTISRLMDTAARLRMVRQAQRRFMQLWAEQRTHNVTRNLLFPTPARRSKRRARRSRSRD